MLFETGRQKNIFIADKQTRDDLNLTGKYKTGSVYGIFDRVNTEGGAKLLEELFRFPLTDVKAINRRSEAFLYFQKKAVRWPFSRAEVALVAEYLGSEVPGNSLSTMAGMLKLKTMEMVLKDEQYASLSGRIAGVFSFIDHCRQFIRQFEKGEDSPVREQLDAFRVFLDDARIAGLPSSVPAGEQIGHSEEEKQTLPWRVLAHYHQLFGNKLHERLSGLLASVYEFDVAVAVSNVARDKGFSYAQAITATGNLFRAVDLRHPGIERAIGNTLQLDADSNVLFLTGANMAGKSTLMKSFGIAVYLAHMGFPVAAREMVFSVRDGLYSSINVPDNLELGYSHFYAEVRRVKQVASEVAQSKSLVVIFDELFKGTNVKDAYDATLAVSTAFADYRKCLFILSTHITEVGEALKRSRDNLRFVRLPTVMEGRTPRYTYKLAEGISEDRHGMMILENEGILDIIRHV